MNHGREDFIIISKVPERGYWEPFVAWLAEQRSSRRNQQRFCDISQHSTQTWQNWRKICKQINANNKTQKFHRNHEKEKYACVFEIYYY